MHGSFQGVEDREKSDNRYYEQHSPNLQYQGVDDKKRVVKEPRSRQGRLVKILAQIQEIKCQKEEAKGHQREERIHSFPTRAETKKGG